MELENSFGSIRLYVADHLDGDDDLEMSINNGESIYLTREQVIELRNHLDEVLGDE